MVSVLLTFRLLCGEIQCLRRRDSGLGCRITGFLHVTAEYRAWTREIKPAEAREVWRRIDVGIIPELQGRSTVVSDGCWCCCRWCWSGGDDDGALSRRVCSGCSGDPGGPKNAGLRRFSRTPALKPQQPCQAVPKNKPPESLFVRAAIQGQGVATFSWAVRIYGGLWRRA